MALPAQSDPLFVAAGTLFGRYEVVAPIGRGGMGEVYRARDTQLHRDVALKILVAEYGADAERLRRFEQEARAMGQLSHPNIVAVYDVGRTDAGTPYVVTELLEGETLRDLLASGAIPSARATEYALQIARGLAAAHGKNIVHRDLKPGNIFVTHDGLLKILDFGLAKLLHPEWESYRVDESTLSMTAPGMILGTVAYMAPEQLEGAAVDFRSDIFAFGAVMYEMLTGVRPFTGTSPASLVASILREEPTLLSPASELIPRSLLPIVRRCLEKRPAARFQSTRDLVFALEQSSQAHAPASTTLRVIRTVAAHPQVRRTAFASALIGITIAVLLLTSSSPPTQAERTRAASLVSTRITTEGNVLATDGCAVGISPDAVYVAYIRAGEPEPALTLRHIPTGSEVQLRPPAWYDSVSISPDRNYVYYTVLEAAGASLYRIPLLGGAPRLIAENVDGSSPMQFSRDGAQIVFTRSTAATSAVWIAATDGSAARAIVTRPRKDVWFHGCAWTYDNREVSCSVEMEKPIIAFVVIDPATGRVDERRGVFSQRANYLGSHVWLDSETVAGIAQSAITRFSVGGQSAEKLTREGASYSAMSLARDRGIFAAAQSNAISKIWRVRADAASSPEQVLSGFNTEEGRYGMAPLKDGRIIYAAESTNSLDLWIREVNGERRRIVEHDGTDEVRPQVSPDEKSLAFLRRSDQSAYELWIADLNGEHARKLTDHAEGPSFSADGQSVYFTRNLLEGPRLYRISTSGGEPERITERPCAHVGMSPDARYLLANCQGKDAAGKATFDAVLMPLAPDARERTFKASAPHRWRPDSSGFAYVTKNRRAVVYQSLDGSKPRELANFPETINAIAWSRDGTSIYVSTTQTLTDVVLLSEPK